MIRPQMMIISETPDRPTIVGRRSRTFDLDMRTTNTSNSTASRWRETERCDMPVKNVYCISVPQASSIPVSANTSCNCDEDFKSLWLLSHKTCTSQRLSKRFPFSWRAAAVVVGSPMCSKLLTLTRVVTNTGTRRLHEFRRSSTRKDNFRRKLQSRRNTMLLLITSDG
ncbi:hypothetical protein CY34DRAFT_665728 [Suillus luteus UH-Slu-Lm8-n1]|uniref:Uncharacterized protein n=1 Tax=Suillus luteus UH-Slu-Lm8-n1 TaxID=930992 RepID=A0A0D0A772_9AGAM|nr:hypothetical protein CY34DRAFT_665728 [Suillus luteus UH-Slu-Lm8-n1]